MNPTLAKSVSDSIREYVLEKYLKNAIRSGRTSFAVHVGEVHKALRLTNRVPQVCAALESKKLLNENGLRIVSRTGPPSGRSTTVTFTYEIVPRLETEASQATNPLWKIRGLAKEIFQALGGGENFIRNERSSFREHSKK